MSSNAVHESLVSATEDLQRVLSEIEREVVGARTNLELVLAMLCGGGHALMVGVPGVGKTSLVLAMARCLGISGRRVQFTPDLMPIDLLGSERPTHVDGVSVGPLRFVEGPVFTNLLVADELNRTSPKVQAALLEAMQERQCTVGGETRPLPDPFHVLATQNPDEEDGTYPLPTASLDRFDICVRMTRPSREDELEITRRILDTERAVVRPVLSHGEFLRIRDLVSGVPITPSVLELAVDIARSTRAAADCAEEQSFAYLDITAGTRPAGSMLRAARARAVIRGRGFVTEDDVLAFARATLRHRVRLSPEGEAEFEGNVETWLDRHLEPWGI